MLVLSRKSQEAVVVSGTSGIEQLLKVTVLEVRGGNVKLGFEARARGSHSSRPRCGSGFAPRVRHPFLSQSPHGPSIRCLYVD